MKFYRSVSAKAMVQSASIALFGAFIAIQFISWVSSATIALIIFVSSAFVISRKWDWLEKRRLQKLEQQFPIALQSIAIDLKLGVPFEKALSHAAENATGLVSKEFAKTVNEIQQLGASVPEALFRLGERNPNTMVRRIASQLISCYDQGSESSVESIQRLSKELMQKQRTQSKEFAGKMALYSLLFIAASAIIPALFQSYLIVGSLFLEGSMTPMQVLLLNAVLFPIIDLGVFAFVQLNTPAFLQH